MGKKRSGRHTNRDANGRESVLLYLRIAKGLSQRELAKSTGMTANDISRFENGKRGLFLTKVCNLAAFFGISCQALVFDDFGEVLSRITRPIEVNTQQRDRNHKRQESKESIGYAGEDWVTDLERQKLAGTPYANAVNPNFSGDDKTHFDILSFTPEGKWVYIEVKSTAGDADEEFFMSAAELRFLQECLCSGKRYELHRVYHVKDPALRAREIYTAREVLEQFTRSPNSYMLKKEAA